MVGLGSKRVLLKREQGRGRLGRRVTSGHPRSAHAFQHGSSVVAVRGRNCVGPCAWPHTISLATSHMAANPPVVAIAVTTDIEMVVEKQAMASGKRHVNDSNRIAFS
jgi:hypothetical protein|eukprot:507168-Prymnesium_polylepis.2